MRALVDELCGGDGRDLLLVGPAGVGKTSLLDVAVEAAADRGVRVARVTGEPLEDGIAWGVATQLATQLQPSDRDAPALHGLLLPTGVSGGPDTLHRLEVLRWMVEGCAEQRPLLIVVDDAHWVDPPTLRWLRYLQRRLDELPVSLLLGVRDGEATTDNATMPLAALASDERCGTIRLAPLSDSAIEGLVRQQIPDATVAFCGTVVETVAGNPFLLHELLRAVEDAGVGPEDRDQLVSLRPAAVRSSVLVRLSMLGPTCSALAHAIAALGSSATVGRAAAVAEVEEAVAAEAIDRLVAADLVRLHPTLAFAHPIVADTIREDTGPALTRTTHTRAAAVLHRDGASPEEVAENLLRGEVPREPWAIEALRQAATAAAGAGDPTRAVQLLRVAAPRVSDPTARLGVLQDLAAMEVIAGEAQATATMDEVLGLLTGTDDGAHAAAQLGEVLYASGRYVRSARAFRTGLDATGDPRQDPAAARLLAGWITAGRMASEDVDAALHLLNRSVDRTGQDDPLGPADRLLAAIAAGEHAIGGTRPAREVVALVDRALGTANGAAGDPVDELGPVIVQPVVGALYCAGRFEQALLLLDRSIAAARRAGALAAHIGLLPLRGLMLLESGRLADAVADATWALDVVEEVPVLPPTVLVPARAVVAMAALEADDLDTTAETLGGGEVDRLVGTPFLGMFHMARGQLHAARHDPAAAVAAHEAAGTCFAAAGGNGPAFEWRSLMVPPLLALGRDGEARDRADEGLRLARTFGAPRPLALALLASARVAPSTDDELDMLAEAVDVVNGSEARTVQARALVAHGAALRRSGARRDSRDRLREGLELARTIGLHRLEVDAVEELAASGARRPELALVGREALTPSERRVARLAAEGLTNREIAGTLFVTRKTVEVHLSATYRKLGIASRTELPAALDPQ